MKELIAENCEKHVHCEQCGKSIHLYDSCQYILIIMFVHDKFSHEFFCSGICVSIFQLGQIERYAVRAMKSLDESWIPVLNQLGGELKKSIPKE